MEFNIDSQELAKKLYKSLETIEDRVDEIKKAKHITQEMLREEINI